MLGLSIAQDWWVVQGVDFDSMKENYTPKMKSQKTL